MRIVIHPCGHAFITLSDSIAHGGASFSALPGAVFTILARVLPLAPSMTVTVFPSLS